MKKKNDVIETYYDNGQLESRSNYKDDKLNGLYETWYKNGQLKARGIYKDDKLEGLWEIWYLNGQLMSRTYYENDKPDGLHEILHENGQLVSRVICKDGVAVEQENDRNVSKEELLRLVRENLALKIMVLRDKQLAHEITYKESLKQLIRLIEEYDKNKIENYGMES